MTSCIAGQSPDSAFINENVGTEFHQGKQFFTDKEIGFSHKKTTKVTKEVGEDTAAVVLSVRAPVGDVNIVRRKICIGRGLFGIVPKKNVDVEYLFFAMSALSRFLQKQSSGTTFKAINGKTVRELHFPLPPLSEQYRITTKINHLFKQINRIEKARKELSSLSEKFRQLCLEKAIQGRLAPQLESEPASEPDLPISSGSYEVPKNWRWVPLKYLGIIRTGTTPSTECAEYYGTDIPFVKPGDILNGKIFYRQEGLSNNARSVARVTPPESILMVCIGGSIGKTATTDREVSFNQQINAITCFKGVVSSEYLSYAFHSNYFQKEVRSKSSGTATPIINKSRWESIVVPLPPIREQALIAIKISKIFNLMRKIMK